MKKYKIVGLPKMHNGGIGPGHPHEGDPPSYQDAVQAYEDSIAAKEAYEKQYALDLKDYEKNNANAKSVYNKDLKRYNYKWDRYRDSKAYVEYLSDKYDYMPKSFDDPMLQDLEPSEWNAESNRNSKGHRSVRNKDGKEFAHMIDETLWKLRPESDPDNFLNRSLILWADANMKDYANRKLNNVVTTDTKLYAPPSDHPEWNTFYREYGFADAGKNTIEMYGKPNQKKPTLKDLEALEHNPPEVLERPNFSDYVDPMSVIKPQPITGNNLEIIGDYDEPEELERPTYNAWEGMRPQKVMGAKNPLYGGRRLSGTLAQKLSGYDSDAMHAEIEAAENEGRRINFEGLGKGSASSGRFQRQYNKEYDVYEEALKEQKYLNTVPRFFKDGGPYIGAVPKYAPGGAYGPGDGIKKFIRDNNVQASVGYGKLPFHGSNYTPQFGLNAVLGSSRKGFWDLGATAGGDKNGFSGGLTGTYYGPFMSGNRHMQGKVGNELYYDQGTLGYSGTGAWNFLGGNRNIGNKRDQPYRPGTWTVEGGPFLQVGVHNDLSKEAPSYLNEQQVGTPIWETGKKIENTKWDFTPGAGVEFKWRPKKVPLTFSASGRFGADLVDSFGSGAAKGHEGETVYENEINTDASPYIATQYQQVGEPMVAVQPESAAYKPEYKWDFGAKMIYDIDYNGGHSKRKKKIKQLEENDPFYNPGVRNSQGSLEGVNEELDEQKYGGPHDPPLFKEFLGEEPGTFTTENFQDKDGYNLELLYPRTNMKRRPTRFGYDDYDKGYTEITKGDENYKGIKKELKPIVKQEFKEQKLKKRFPREEYYTGNKTYKPSQEFLDQVAYQAAHKGEDKMGDTDVLVNMIYDDLNLQGFDTGTNTGTRKQRRLAQRLEHSPAWYAANALKERDALGVSMPNLHEGGNIPSHDHPHQSYRDRWNLEIKQNQDMDMTRHVVNERPLLNLDGTDPDAGYNQWIDQNVDYGTNPNKSWFTHAYEGVAGIPELLTETIPNYIAETAEDAYDQFKKSSILPANIANAKKDTSRSIRERLYRTVTPIGYDWKHAAKEFIAGEHLPFKWDGQDVTFETFDKMDRFKDGTYGQYIKDASMDAWGMYLGIPQKYDTYKTSQYKPSKSKNKNAKYYSFNWDDDIWDEALENKVHELETNKSKSITDSGSGGFTLQNYKLSKGYDKEKKLPYISYYDNNDYNIDLGAFDIKGEDIVGEAFEVYGRMYYDPKTKKRVFPESKLSTPEEWEQEIRRVEKEIGNPRGWTMDSYNMLQDKLNEYKGWREKHPEVVDHSNKPNEYVLPLPPHLNADQYKEVELTDKEADKYRAGGYVLEKLVDGGEDDVVRPHGDSYEYKKVGNKYYTRKREGEWESEGQPGWDLASGGAEDAIKYKVFKEQKPEPVIEDPFYTYDINDRKNFDSRYWNDIKLDQSQDGLKPANFSASNLPLVGLDGTDPDAEYNAYVAAKPQYKKASSWVDKNVFEPIGDLYDDFQKTSLGPIDDAANAVNEMFIQPVVDLATDTYNDPNKVSGEILQMMVDGITLLPDAAAEGIYSNIINPDAEFNTSVLGDPKSLERFGQIAAAVPAIPSVFGKTAKTAAVANKVDDVVNVANKTKKTIPRPKPSTTTAMAETSSGNVVPVNNLQSVKNSRYMKGSDGKTYLRESEYNNFTGTRKANLDKKIAKGEVEVLRQTPDGNAYLLSDKSIANIDTTVKAKLDRMKTDKGRQLTFEQEKAYIKKEFPEMDEASINQAANQAADARIAEVESLYKNQNYQEAYYDLEEMNAHMEIGDDVINSTQYQPEQVTNFDKTVNPVNQNANMRFHPNLADDSAIVSHEAGHITAPGRNLPIEDEILNAVGSPKNLSAQDQAAYDYLAATSKKRQKLIDDMRNHDPSNANLSEAELIDKYSNLGQSKGDIFTGDYTFANDIKKVQQLSSEVLPYAQELKQVLLDRGLIDDWFQEITPDILAKAKQAISQEPAGFYTADMLGNVENATSTTRLLDITDPSRYQQLSNSLNKIAPVAVPAAAVGTGTMMNEQDGGFIEAELSDEERDQYRLDGYIVEKIQ